MGLVLLAGGSRDFDRTVLVPPQQFLIVGGDDLFEESGVVGGRDVEVEHLGEERRLASIEVVDPSSVGNEAVLVDEVYKVLKDPFRRLLEPAGQESDYGPVGVPLGGGRSVGRNIRGSGRDASGAQGYYKANVNQTDRSQSYHSQSTLT